MHALLPWLALVALAEVPVAPTPDCAEDNREGCLPDMNGYEWYSWIEGDERKGTIRPAELELGSGMSADVAFGVSTGRWDVVVAYTDSGVYWEQFSNKVFLNTGELPVAQNAAGELVDDLDGNGIINIQDYAEDPRVDPTSGVDSADDRLDPSDLIATFSDGIDDDGNGYIDDIAGWDFFSWDNDPYAQYQKGFASHGTGVAKLIGEEGGDGGGVGVCPNCAVLPLRIGDTFIVDGDRVGAAIAYATDMGVTAVAMANGSITHPGRVEDAVNYAEAHNVVLVGAAADENSYHHNVPSMEDPILYVHTVSESDGRQDGTYTYMAFNGCNNFGPRVDLVVSLNNCATGSTAVTAGAAGLLQSAARDAGLELTAPEIRALLRGDVDDVYLTDAEREIANTYPSKAGWDAFYGYGRLNLGRSALRVAAGDIPPSVRLTSPEWFGYVRSDGPAIEVVGSVSAPRASGVSWTLEVAAGVEPDEWTSVASGDGAADGVLGTVDPSVFATHVFDDLIFDEGVVDRFYRAHLPAVQVKLTATDSDGRTAETRRTVWVHEDPTLLPGFPLTFDGSLEPPPLLADLDGDGDHEVVLFTAGGELHVFQHDGSELEGFPVQTEPHWWMEEASESPAFASGAVRLGGEGSVAAPAVGDIDGDGVPEVVAGTLGGRIYAWHPDGKPVAGFPVRIDGREPEEFLRGRGWDNGFAAAPTLADIDGDGAYEIIVGAMDQRLYVWSGDGSRFPNYPMDLCIDCDNQGFRILSSAAVGDVDNDGDLDCVIGTNEVPDDGAGVAWMIDLKTAQVASGWPKVRDGLIDQTILPVLGEGHPASIALADVDGDGDLEIASNAMLGSADLIHHDGSNAREIGYVQDQFGSRASFGGGSFLGMATNPAFGDLTGDGVPDFSVGGSSIDYMVSLALTKQFEFEHALGAWDGATGQMLRGFPREVDDVSFLVSPSIADVTGDGMREVLYGTGGYFVYAWDADGTIAPTFPKFTGGWIIGGSSLGDLDGDGYLELVVGTREGNLFAWHTDGRADQTGGWPMAFHDARNTGNHETVVAPQAGPPDVVEASGCCKKDGGPEQGAALLLLLPLALRRRRVATR